MDLEVAELLYRNTAIETLLVVRHGQSLMNLRKKSLFWCDDKERQDSGIAWIPDEWIPLSQEGLSQAAQTGREVLKIAPVDTIIYSSHLRAVETAREMVLAMPAQFARKMKLIRQPLLIERSVGESFFMTQAEFEDAHPNYQKYWDNAGPFQARPPGGESCEDVVVNRVIPFLRGPLLRVRGKHLSIVAHGRTNQCIRYAMEGWTPEKFCEEADRVGLNCSITVYKRDDEQGRLVFAGYHLEHCHSTIATPVLA